MRLIRSFSLLTVLSMTTAIAACDDGGSSGTTTSLPASTTSGSSLAEATFTVQPGTEQVAVLGATAGTELSLRKMQGEVVAVDTVDQQGSLLFRNVVPGDYVVEGDTQRSAAFNVARVTDVPPRELYTQAQTLLPDGGFGYIVTRDGTTLSANVVLPGPAADGPYPTVVEYSGYQPSDPGSSQLARLYTAQGFAYVGVNTRGTGCSGGSYRFFETVQSLDGYDVIEAVAAQPWVLDHEVGMVGISYPGISQLFVAATQPPSLNSISPMSVIDDSYRGTLYPGGILNTGFAVDWITRVVDKAKPFGQAWTQDRADEGDEVCADNQLLRLQNPDLIDEIDDNPFYSYPLGDSLAPATFVDRITVPVFIAGAWQDEQTGGHFATMLSNFTSSPHVYVTVMNGLHTDPLNPSVLARYAEFLQLYVGKKVPEVSFGNVLAALLGGVIWGVTTFPPFVDRFDGMTYDEALAAFEAESPVRVLFEQGGDDDYVAGTPAPNFVGEFDAWPIPQAEARTWVLGAGGRLASESAAATGADSYVASPDALPATFYDGDESALGRVDVQYDWQPLPDGTGVGYVTDPLAIDSVIAGSGSVDLWVKADASDTDLEVTLSEVRPDGKEIYVQSGWLRASQRTLDEQASTELRPVQLHTKDVAADLPPDQFTPVRVELFPFAHPFRAGSRIRLTIDAPGNNRARWVFDTISDGETVTIAHDAAHPSQLVLSVVPGAAVPQPAPPACGALRGQPCREWVPAANGG